MRVDTLAEDKSGGLLCLHMYLRLGNEGEHQGKNQEAKRLGIPCGPVVRTLPGFYVVTYHIRELPTPKSKVI